MGLGDSDPTAEKGAAAEIYCSICLDIVRASGNRSTAKLQCGHQFHLDCIGSAFNAKGIMQCPNCREIGKGDWLYSNGSRSLPERSFDEWTYDEDLYDFSYSEMPFGVHWCPFSRLARLPTSFEEGETAPAIAFQDLSGYHAMFTGNAATSSSSSNQCPYLAYMPPLQPSSSSNPPFSAENHSDGVPFHHHWRHTSRQTDVQTPHILPAVDLHFHNWEHRSPLYSQTGSHTGGSNQETDSSASVRSVVRVDSDGLRRAGSPVRYVLGQGNGSRSAGSFVSTISPPYFTNPQSHPHVRDHYQHHNPLNIHGGPLFSGSRQSGGMRGPYGPLDQTSYYLFPPTASSSRSSQESTPESMHGDHFYSPFPLQPVDRETTGWWRHVPRSAGSSDSGNRWGFWHRNGSERPSSHGRAESSSYRMAPVSRMMPYN